MYKLKLNQIREVLGMSVKLESITLKDGTIVEVEKLEVGFPLQVIAEDGSLSNAAEGDYTLEDGTVLTVDANGLIAEIASAVEETETEIPVAAAEEAPVEDTPKEDAPADAVAELEKRVDEKMALLFAAIEECATEISAMKETMNAVSTKMEKFAKTPAGNKIPNAIIEEEVKLSALDARIENLKNLTKK